MTIPKHSEMFGDVLSALREMDGSGTIAEIDARVTDKLIASERITEEEESRQLHDAERGAGTRSRDATVKLAESASSMPAPVLPSDGARRLFGNMILSRLPVVQAFRHLLPWPVDPENTSMQRVLVEVVVEAPFGALRVMTTHLEYYSAVQRAAQVERIRELHTEAALRLEPMA